MCVSVSVVWEYVWNTCWSIWMGINITTPASSTYAAMLDAWYFGQTAFPHMHNQIIFIYTDVMPWGLSFLAMALASQCSSPRCAPAPHKHTTHAHKHRHARRSNQNSSSPGLYDQQRSLYRRKACCMSPNSPKYRRKAAFRKHLFCILYMWYIMQHVILSGWDYTKYRQIETALTRKIHIGNRLPDKKRPQWQFFSLTL